MFQKNVACIGSPGSLRDFHSSFPEEQKYGFPKIPHPMFPEVPEEQNQAYFTLK